MDPKEFACLQALRASRLKQPTDQRPRRIDRALTRVRHSARQGRADRVALCVHLGLGPRPLRVRDDKGGVGGGGGGGGRRLMSPPRLLPLPFIGIDGIGAGGVGAGAGAADTTGSRCFSNARVIAFCISSKVANRTNSGTPPDLRITIQSDPIPSMRTGMTNHPVLLVRRCSTVGRAGDGPPRFRRFRWCPP
jgi:hypothetical protein